MQADLLNCEAQTILDVVDGLAIPSQAFAGGLGRFTDTPRDLIKTVLTFCLT